MSADSNIPAASFPDRSVEIKPQTLAQLKVIEVLANLPLVVYGGFAEDALVSGKVQREHDDIDALIKREDISIVLSQLRAKGFECTHQGKIEGGPDKITITRDSVVIDVTVVEMTVNNDLYVDITGKDDSEYRAYLDKETFNQPPVQLEGKMIKTASPKALLQITNIVASRFGPRNKDIEQQAVLADKFFPEISLADLQPRIVKTRTN